MRRRTLTFPSFVVLGSSFFVLRSSFVVLGSSFFVWGWELVDFEGRVGFAAHLRPPAVQVLAKRAVADAVQPSSFVVLRSSFVVLGSSFVVVGYWSRVLCWWGFALGFEIADETSNGGTDSGGQVVKDLEVILGQISLIECNIELRLYFRAGPL